MRDVSAPPRFCHLCGRRLSTRYYRYESGLIVCAACQSSRLRCARCGVPLGDHDTHSHASTDGPLCAACYRAAHRCSSCGQAIAGTWYTFEEMMPQPAPRYFCPRCVQSRPRCDLCRAPVGEHARPLVDGQYRCPACSADLVLDVAGIRDVYREAVAAVTSVTRTDLRAIPTLEVIGRRRMGEIRREHRLLEPEAGGSATSYHVLGFFVRAHDATTIYVEMGLPRALLLGTLAHELAHAWQAEQAPHLRDPLMQEGFAEWVAHRVLAARGNTLLAARATRRDDVYGRGLRHFLDIERKGGPQAVLRAIRNA